MYVFNDPTNYSFIPYNPTPLLHLQFVRLDKLNSFLVSAKIRWMASFLLPLTRVLICPLFTNSIVFVAQAANSCVNESCEFENTIHVNARHTCENE